MTHQQNVEADGVGLEVAPPSGAYVGEVEGRSARRHRPAPARGRASLAPPEEPRVDRQASGAYTAEARLSGEGNESSMPTVGAWQTRPCSGLFRCLSRRSERRAAARYPRRGISNPSFGMVEAHFGADSTRALGRRTVWWRDLRTHRGIAGGASPAGRECA